MDSMLSRSKESLSIHPDYQYSKFCFAVQETLGESLELSKTN